MASGRGAMSCRPDLKLIQGLQIVKDYRAVHRELGQALFFLAYREYCYGCPLKSNVSLNFTTNKPNPFLFLATQQAGVQTNFSARETLSLTLRFVADRVRVVQMHTIHGVWFHSPPWLQLAENCNLNDKMQLPAARLPPPSPRLRFCCFMCCMRCMRSFDVVPLLRNLQH